MQRSTSSPRRCSAARPITSASRSSSSPTSRRTAITYRTSDGIYFDTSKQPDYGYLARLDKAGLEAGNRVDLGEKKSATDFALWKFSPPGEKRQMEWASPWGVGLSRMAYRMLGDGAEISRRLSSTSIAAARTTSPVHHTNEIAQTEARVGTRLANFWMHGYFLLSNDAKMAKSAASSCASNCSIERGYDPLAYRYLCLTAHYRSQLNFTWDALDAAAIGLDRMRNGVHALRRPAASPSGLPRALHRRVNDDLNLPRALAIAWELLRGDCPIVR